MNREVYVFGVVAPSVGKWENIEKIPFREPCHMFVQPAFSRVEVGLSSIKISAN